MRNFIKALQHLFVFHDWKVKGHSRTCRTCGRRDEYVVDDPSSHWDMIASGDVSKHR